MKTPPNYLKTQIYWLVPYSLLLLATGVLQILYRQSIIIAYINQHYSAAADWFFEYTTFMGDGRFCVVVGLLFLALSYRKAILILSAFAISGLLSIALKNLFDEPRPSAYFGSMMQYFHTIPSIELAQAHSFPSGHTTSAFALFVLFGIWAKSPYLKPFWLLPAVAVAYSRMYLFQHFLVDVFFGSMLGTITALICDYFLTNYWNKKPKNWHEKRLF